jgi:glycosyltransferase involved in cell wall biosynthesis
MPVYNAEKFIRPAIESVLSQTNVNWELIPIDDLSKDFSRTILQEYAEKDPRIKPIYKPVNSGSADTRNKGIEKAIGRYIAFLDSDDLWDNIFLESQLKFMKVHNSKFSFSSYRNIDENGNEILNPYIASTFRLTYFKNLINNRVGLLTAIYDTESLGKMYFDINLKSLRDDYALWLDILKRIECGYGNREILASFRHRIGSVTSSKRKVFLPHFKLLRYREKLNFITASFFTFTHMLISYIKKY